MLIIKLKTITYIQTGLLGNSVFIVLWKIIRLPGRLVNIDQHLMNIRATPDSIHDGADTECPVIRHRDCIQSNALANQKGDLRKKGKLKGYWYSEFGQLFIWEVTVAMFFLKDETSYHFQNTEQC